MNLNESSPVSIFSSSLAFREVDCLSSLPNARLLSKYLASMPLPNNVDTDTDDSSKMLPKSYQPSEYDVVCGRGKGFYNKPGNRRFRSIVSTYIDDYESCKSKIDKSLILGQIVDRVREQDNGRARFLKYDTKLKCWCVLTNDQAREKVGHAIRECVQSTKDKQINEAKQLQLQKQEEYHQLHILTQMLFSS